MRQMDLNRVQSIQESQSIGSITISKNVNIKIQFLNVEVQRC
jgi:hypothetical protein